MLFPSFSQVGFKIFTDFLSFHFCLLFKFRQRLCAESATATTPEAHDPSTRASRHVDTELMEMLRGGREQHVGRYVGLTLGAVTQSSSVSRTASRTVAA